MQSVPKCGALTAIEGFLSVSNSGVFTFKWLNLLNNINKNENLNGLNSAIDAGWETMMPG
jgi:hypothetical protein